MLRTQPSVNIRTGRNLVPPLLIPAFPLILFFSRNHFVGVGGEDISLLSLTPFLPPELSMF